MTIDERIARYIIKAQISSDAGKYIRNDTGSRYRIARSPEKFGYDMKTWYIYQALKLIRSNKQSMFNYYVTDYTPDQNGHSSIITYFDFNIDGKRYQISFHTPEEKIPIELLRMCGTGRKTRWRKSVSSIDSTRALVKKFNLDENAL